MAPDEQKVAEQKAQIEAYAKEHGKDPKELTEAELKEATGGGDMATDAAAGAGIGELVAPESGPIGPAVGAVGGAITSFFD